MSRLFVTAILFLVIPPAASGEDSAEAVVPRRAVAASGFRRVRCDLSQSGAVSRSMTIVTTWRREGTALESVSSVVEGPGIVGTSILMKESEFGAAAPKIFLRLRGGRTLELDPSLIFEGLLGSDMSYWDSAFWPPLAGMLVSSGEASEASTRNIWIRCGSTTPADCPFDRASLRFDDTSGLLLTGDFYSGRRDSPIKKMEVKTIRKHPTGPVPEHMRFTREGLATDVHLLDYAAPVEGLQKEWFHEGELEIWQHAALRNAITLNAGTVTRERE